MVLCGKPIHPSECMEGVFSEVPLRSLPGVEQ
jgi:hypothetical protein